MLVWFLLEVTAFTVWGKKACVPMIILIFKLTFHCEENLLLPSTESDETSFHETECMIPTKFHYLSLLILA